MENHNQDHQSEPMMDPSSTDQMPTNPDSNQANNKNLLQIIIAVIITAIVVGGGMALLPVYLLDTEGDDCIPEQSNSVESFEIIADELDDIEDMQEVAREMANKFSGYTQIAEYNCEQSGGVFKDDNCQCSEGAYDPLKGYCMTDIGVPGGELQKVEAKLQELRMVNTTIVKYNCEQSGGTYGDDGCVCPLVDADEFKYDLETGYCMSSAGLPGGKLGETEQTIQEVETLKN